MHERDSSSLEDVAKALSGKRHGTSWQCKCPAHDDNNASLSLTMKAGKLLWKCHAGCEQGAVLDALKARGLWHANGNGNVWASAHVVSTYDYVDEAGDPVFQVLRYHPKAFKQRRPDGKGGWIWSVHDVRHVPYRLPEIAEAIGAEHPVFVVEGEKDCNALAKLGIVATCNAGGAGKWKEAHAACLRGGDVIVVPDNDEPGRKHAEAVGRSLQGVATRVRVLELPGLPEKGDVSDWIKSGGSAEELWRLAHKVEEWNDPNAGQSKGDAWNDPDWSLLDTRRGELLDFPIDVLPPAWQHWLQRAARGAGVNVDHVVVPLLSVTSSLIGTARRVRASRSWSQPHSLWTAVVGFSGTGKTPGLDVSQRALSRIERNRRGSVEELRLAHEQKATAAKAALRKWKNEMQEAVDKGHKPPSKPAAADDPGPFVAPRFCVTDSTVERLAVLIQARQRGMLVVVDELAALFSNMCRYTNGSDREFWLAAWNGGHHVVERLGRPPVVIDHLLVGLTGGFQPDKLLRSFKGDDDGMYARVLFSWPSEPGYEPLSDVVDEVEPEFLEALMRLIDLPVESGPDLIPRYLPLSEEAREQFEQFRQSLHAGKRSLDGREREWWAKGTAHVLRLAGTLTYMDWAMHIGPMVNGDARDRFQQMLQRAAEPPEIKPDVMTSAVRLWREYFWPHARACLRQAGLSDRHRDARRVLKWLQAQGQLTVSREDIRRDALGQQLDAEGTEKLLDALAKSGWLRREAMEHKGRGRPANRWLVNPKLMS
jgi:hypothetical protein